MQTILGANAQIAVELARELRRKYASELRLVSRNPRKINDADVLVSADLLDAGQTAEAVKGSDIVYFTAGLPPDTELWEKQFPVMLRNALEASRAAAAKFAYFDNTYMYPQDYRFSCQGILDSSNRGKAESPAHDPALQPRPHSGHRLPRTSKLGERIFTFRPAGKRWWVRFFVG